MTMKSPSVEERQAQLAACAEAAASLATNRNIVAQHVSKLDADHEIRKVLDAIVRRWSQLEGPTHCSQGSLGRLARELHKDHAVPVRVLVDRMIMNPAECRALLESAIVLVVLSRDEHLQLGGIYADHEETYRQMLAAPVDALIYLAWNRYRSAGIQLEPYIA